MKKFLVSMMAAFMVFAFAGPAAAYFETGNVVLSIYHYEKAGRFSPEVIGKEVGLDLGNIFNMSALTNQTLWAAGSFSATDFGLTSLSGLKAGIYSNKAKLEGVNLTNYEFGLSKDMTPVFSSSATTNFRTAYNAIRELYDDSGTGKAVVDASDANSYFKKMISGGTSAGAYGDVNLVNASSGEVALSDAGYADMYLYRYELVTGSGFVLNTGSVYGETTPYEAVIRLYSDGSVVLNPLAAPVPVPGALLLLSSGLLGLVGIRRKK